MQHFRTRQLVTKTFLQDFFAHTKKENIHSLQHVYKNVKSVFMSIFGVSCLLFIAQATNAGGSNGMLAVAKKDVHDWLRGQFNGYE